MYKQESCGVLYGEKYKDVFVLRFWNKVHVCIFTLKKIFTNFISWELINYIRIIFEFGLTVANHRWNFCFIYKNVWVYLQQYNTII